MVLKWSRRYEKFDVYKRVNVYHNIRVLILVSRPLLVRFNFGKLESVGSQSRGVLHKAGWRNPMSDLKELRSTGSSLPCTATPLLALSSLLLKLY